MPTTRGRDAGNAFIQQGRCAPVTRIFGKINVSAASADKRLFARLLDQKPLHLTDGLTLQAVRRPTEDPDVGIVREAGHDGRADEA